MTQATWSSNLRTVFRDSTTNGFYQRQSFIKGISFNKMNHFLDKGNELDPVSMDLQKSIWWNVPLKNFFYRRTTESGGNSNNVVIDVGMLHTRECWRAWASSGWKEGTRYKELWYWWGSTGNDRDQTKNIIDCLRNLRTVRHKTWKEILPTELPAR